MNKKLMILLSLITLTSMIFAGCGGAKAEANDTAAQPEESVSEPVQEGVDVEQEEIVPLEEDYAETADGSFGGTFVEAEEGATYKGIVYFDPTNLKRICKEEDAVANINQYGTPTEVIAGPMKWYVFDDEGDTYKLICDHNTTAAVSWDKEGKDIPYEESAVKRAVDDLVSMYGWQVEPRLISGEEVAKLTGNKDWPYAWYYLDTNSYGMGEWTETEKSKYDWMYNYLMDSIVWNEDPPIYSGGTLDDRNSYPVYEGEISESSSNNSSTYGYWTSTTTTQEDEPMVWYISDAGSLRFDTPVYPQYGVRPVVELDKEFVNPTE